MWPRRLPPHRLSEGVFPLRCLAIAFGAKQVRTRELKEPGEFTCSQCGFYIVIPKANWSFTRSFSKEHTLRTNSMGVRAAISNWSHDPYRTFSNPRNRTTALNI
jgi:hypothetical protein